MPVRKIFVSVILLCILIPGKEYCQTPSSYHQGVAASPRGYSANIGTRPFKTSIDAGLVLGAAGTTGISSNYVNGISNKLGYTFGLIEEIPVQSTAYIDVGIEILEEGLSFNSYFFAPGYSSTYNGDEIYNHDIVMNEIQVPVLYKFQLGPPDRKLRSLYMTLGLKLRYITYTNSTVTSDSTGYLVWEGQKDLTFYRKLFSPFAGSLFEMSLGYQRNTKAKRKRGWYMELEYNYGFSPLVYSGNKDGSNNIVFRLNSLMFKIGKIF